MSDSTPVTAAEQEVLITRIFDAPREKVFRAWTDPDHDTRIQVVALVAGSEHRGTLERDVDLRHGSLLRMAGPAWPFS